jgi:MFS family permease
VLFNFVAVFTYISFHLAAPPYNFSSTLLGAIFVTFLVGAAVVSTTGIWVTRWGRRAFVLGVMAVWVSAIALTLSTSVIVIMCGLAICAACGMFVQATSTGYVTSSVKEGRSSAVGLYVSSFYLGGSVGAFLPGLIWNAAGWRGAVAVVIAVQVVMALIVAFIWTRSPPAAAPEPPAV